MSAQVHSLLQEPCSAFQGSCLSEAQLHEASPHSLLQVEALPEQGHALPPHLLQLLLQAQVVLDLLLGVVVPQACSAQQLLQAEDRPVSKPASAGVDAALHLPFTATASSTTMQRRPAI